MSQLKIFQQFLKRTTTKLNYVFHRYHSKISTTSAVHEIKHRHKTYSIIRTVIVLPAGHWSSI